MITASMESIMTEAEYAMITYTQEKMGRFLQNTKNTIIFDTSYISRELQRSRDVSGDPDTIPAFDYSSVTKFFRQYGTTVYDALAVVEVATDSAEKKSEGLRKALIGKKIQVLLNHNELSSVGFALFLATMKPRIKKDRNLLVVTDDKGIVRLINKNIDIIVGPDEWEEDGTSLFMLQRGLYRFIKFSDFTDMTGANIMTVGELRGITNKKIWEPVTG